MKHYILNLVSLIAIGCGCSGEREALHFASLPPLEVVRVANVASEPATVATVPICQPVSHVSDAVPTAACQCDGCECDPCECGKKMAEANHSADAGKMVAVAQSKAKPKAITAPKGRWVNQRVCNGGSCSVKRVWVPDAPRQTQPAMTSRKVYFDGPLFGRRLRRWR